MHDTITITLILAAVGVRGLRMPAAAAEGFPRGPGRHAFAGVDEMDTHQKVRPSDHEGCAEFVQQQVVGIIGGHHRFADGLPQRHLHRPLRFDLLDRPSLAGPGEPLA